MSDKDYMNQSETHRLRSWILHEMLVGAGRAAIVLVAIGVLVYAIYLVGTLLPPESKEAPSPMGAIEAPLIDRHLA